MLISLARSKLFIDCRFVIFQALLSRFKSDIQKPLTSSRIYLLSKFFVKMLHSFLDIRLWVLFELIVVDISNSRLFLLYSFFLKWDFNVRMEKFSWASQSLNFLMPFLLFPIRAQVILVCGIVFKNRVFDIT